MADYVPTGRQLFLLARIAVDIAVSIDKLATGNIRTDLRTSIDLIELAKEGLIRYTMGERVVRCTSAGRVWVYAHENWRSCTTARAGSGH